MGVLVWITYYAARSSTLIRSFQKQSRPCFPLSVKFFMVQKANLQSKIQTCQDDL